MPARYTVLPWLNTRQKRDPFSKRWMVKSLSSWELRIEIGIASAYPLERHAQPLRGQLGLRDAEPHQIVRQPTLANQRGAGARQGRGGLDTVAALSRQPEKIRHAAVAADDGRRVGGESSKSRPGARDALNVQGGGALQALDAGRHVEILRVCVHGGAGCRVRRRYEQLSGVRFEIKLLRDITDHGPPSDVHPGGRGYVEGGAPLRHQSESVDAGPFRDAVGPRTRGVDQRRGAKYSPW